MSGARAIEAITETLRCLVESGVKEVEEGATVVVGPADLDTGTPSEMHVNLVLYQVEPDESRREETARNTLPLVLSYLITPYAGGDDLAAQRLLGAALRVLHEHPVIADQEELITVTPRSMDEAGIHALRSMALYRLSAALEVRGVQLNRSGNPSVADRRTDHEAAQDLATAAPVLLNAIAPGERAAAQLGEVIELHGRHLCAPAIVRLEHRLLAQPIELPVQDVDAGTARFTLPDTPEDLPAGVWLVSLSCLDQQARTSNEVALDVAPRITSTMPMTVTRDAAGTAIVRIRCEPAVRPGQLAFLLLGELPVPAEPVTGSSLEFRLLHARTRTHAIRLRVDGVDSVVVGESAGSDDPLAGQVIRVM